MAEKTSQGLNLYDYMTDRNRDIYDGTFGKTDGTNPSSMEVINNFMENKLTLNGEKSKQNFNFIENKVVQDGLIASREQLTITTKREQLVVPSGAISDKYTLVLSFINTGNGECFWTNANNDLVVYSYGGIKVQTNDGLIAIHTGAGFNQKGVNNISISLENLTFTASINGVIRKTTVKNTNLSTLNLLCDWSNNISGGYIYGALLYNRPLSPQEIQHNFSVLNNSPSIRSLEATDTQGIKKQLLFATDSDHTSMRTGRTLEEEYMGVLDGMSQEFTSNGSPITVNDALESRLVGATIEGQTKLYKRAKGSQDVWVEIPVTEARDTVNFEYKLDSALAQINNSGIKYPFYQQYVEGETVVQKRAKGSSNEWVTIPQDETRDTVANEYRLYSANGLGSVPSVEDVVDLASGVKTENTKEIVLNGSESWILGTSKTNTTLFYITLSDSIRDPSIKATSNMFNYLASNWAVDSVSFEIASNGRLHVNISNSIATTLQQFKTWLTSNVITVRYQLATPTTIQLTDAQLATYSPYKKQILLNGGGSIKDVLRLNSDGSLSCENKIIERYVDGSAIKSVNTDLTNTAYITLTFNDGTINQSNVFIMSKLYNRNEYIYNQDVVGVFLEGPSYPVRYRLPKSIVGTSIEEVKQYFNLNPDTIRYSLQTPTITTIPKEVNTPVLTNQSNVLSAGEAVSASSFAVKLPTTSSIKKQYAQTLLNNYTGTASANLLKDGRVQIDMTVTIPTTFNQTVFSLPTELRPKVARKVMGFNGNNPVTLLVGTDGTVKIPTTITGTVELCDEYVL